MGMTAVAKLTALRAELVAAQPVPTRQSPVRLESGSTWRARLMAGARRVRAGGAGSEAAALCRAEGGEAGGRSTGVGGGRCK